MAIGKQARTLKIIVPRHNAQRLGPSVTAVVQNVCKQDGVIVQLPPPVQEQPSSAGASSENASEWNSLLISARAQRGPQWDVGTQQFLVEKESDLYYDPTPLLEASRSVSSENKDTQSMPPPDHPSSVILQHQHQQIQQRGYPNPQYPYGPNAGNIPMSAPSTPNRGLPYGAGTPMSAGGGGHGQYFGDSINMTPTRPGPGMMDGVSPSPDMYGRRITRGMSEGYSQNYGS